MRVGEFGRGEFLLLQPVARLRDGERGEFSHGKPICYFFGQASESGITAQKYFSSRWQKPSL